VATDSQPTLDDWLEGINHLAPLIEQYRDEAELERHLPQPLFEAMRDAGLFGLWVPRSLGGTEVDLQTSVRIVEALARLDGSVGWNVMIAANTSLLWANLEPNVALEMCAGSTVIAGTVTAGNGIAVPAGGGFRVSGRWPFASGCHQADWLVCVCQILDNDEPRGAPGGAPQTFTFVLPASECEILDTWNTVGMRGTGSHDFQVQDVFVPEARHFASRGARSYQSGPLYQTSLLHLWPPNIAAVALGVAREAVDAFISLAQTKTPVRSNAVLAQRETVHEKVGQAEALLRSGRAMLFETIRETCAVLTCGAHVPQELTALTRLAAATAVDNAVTAVDVMFTLAGTSAIYTGRTPIDRCFRDIHVVRQHAVVSPASFALAGRHFLGVEASS
jgi:indole-3-acetate monooxygenase